MVSGVASQNENEEPLGEKEEHKKKKRRYYWEVQHSPNEYPELYGPMTRYEIFNMLIEEGYEVPFKIVRLKNVRE